MKNYRMYKMKWLLSKEDFEVFGSHEILTYALESQCTSIPVPGLAWNRNLDGTEPARHTGNIDVLLREEEQLGMRVALDDVHVLVDEALVVYRRDWVQIGHAHCPHW